MSFYSAYSILPLKYICFWFDLFCEQSVFLAQFGILPIKLGNIKDPFHGFRNFQDSIPLLLWKYDDVLIKFLRFDSLPLEHFLFSCYFYSRKSKGSPGSGIFRIIYLLYITTTVKINSAIELNKEMVTLVLVSGVAHRSFVRVIYQWLSTTTLNIWLCGHLYFLNSDSYS